MSELVPPARLPKDASRQMCQFALPRALVKTIDHWRIDRGLNRQQAYELLIRRGLKALGEL